MPTHVWNEWSAGSEKVFFVAEGQEYTVGSDGVKRKTRQYFLPSVKALSLGLEYSYAVPTPTRMLSFLYPLSGMIAGGSAINQKTVVLDHNMELFRILPPSEIRYLTVEEILWV